MASMLPPCRTSADTSISHMNSGRPSASANFTTNRASPSDASPRSLWFTCSITAAPKSPAATISATMYASAQLSEPPLTIATAKASAPAILCARTVSSARSYTVFCAIAAPIIQKRLAGSSARRLFSKNTRYCAASKISENSSIRRFTGRPTILSKSPSMLSTKARPSP